MNIIDYRVNDNIYNYIGLIPMEGKYQIKKDVIKSLIRESLNAKNF